MNIIHNIKLIILSIFIFSSCSNISTVPFEYTTQEITNSIPSTYGIYVETSVSLPEEARNKNLSFSEVELNYTLLKNQGFYTKVALYASTDTTVDNKKSTNDEKLLEIEIPQNISQTNGKTVSEKILQALSNKQESMIFGCENLTLGLPVNSEIKLILKLKVKGSYSLF